MMGGCAAFYGRTQVWSRLSYLATCNDGCRGIDALVPEVVKILIPTDTLARCVEMMLLRHCLADLRSLTVGNRAGAWYGR